MDGLGPSGPPPCVCYDGEGLKPQNPHLRHPHLPALKGWANEKIPNHHNPRTDPPPPQASNTLTPFFASTYNHSADLDIIPSSHGWLSGLCERVAGNGIPAVRCRYDRHEHKT